MKVPAPPIILSLFPNGVSMASKAIEPTTTKDIIYLFIIFILILRGETIPFALKI
jgi:hypothetical protein